MRLLEPVVAAGWRAPMREESATAWLKSAVFGARLGSGSQLFQMCRDSEVRVVSRDGCKELEPVCPGNPGRSNCQGIEASSHLSGKSACGGTDRCKVQGNRASGDFGADRCGSGERLPHGNCGEKQFEELYGLWQDGVRRVLCKGGAAEGRVEDVVLGVFPARRQLTGRYREERSFTSRNEGVTRAGQDWCGKVFSWQFTSADPGETECKKCRGAIGARVAEASVDEVKGQDREPAKAVQFGARNEVEGFGEIRRVIREGGCFVEWNVESAPSRGLVGQFLQILALFPPMALVKTRDKLARSSVGVRGVMGAAYKGCACQGWWRASSTC
jgi:hypothetical protein